jgi:protein O-mannosyl-transferase
MVINARQQLPTFVPPLLILVAGGLAYTSSFWGVFVYDDQLAIGHNPYLRSLWPTWPQMWAPPDNPLTGRPVTAFTFALNYAVGGLNPWGYHLVNLVVHLLAGLTLLGILRHTLRTKVVNRLGVAADRFALTVALLWVVHPLLTESVTYIVIRTESLMGLFFLLTLYCTIRGANAPRGRVWYAAASGACLLGVGSKEIAGVAPVFVLLYDRTFLAGSFGGALRRRTWLYVGLAGTWIALAILVLYGPRTHSVGLGLAEVGAREYVLTQCRVIVHYLWLSLWPHPLVLCYDGLPLARSLGAVWPWALAILLLLTGTLWALFRKPWLGFLGAWFFLTLAPTSSIVPIATEVAAERRMYLPLIAVLALIVVGVSVALRWAAERLHAGEPLRRRAAVTLVVIAAVGGIVLTTQRNLVYRSEEALWRGVLRHWPDSWTAHLAMASHYLRLNRVADAAAEYARAVAVNPNEPRARMNYGGILAMLGRLAEARHELEQSLAIMPDQALAYFQLGRVDEAEGEPADAAEHYLAGLALEPRDAAARSRLGVVLAALGRTEEARTQLTEALRLQPGLAEARAALASLDAAPSGN